MSPPRILVVDDDRLLLGSIRRVLSYMLSVETATSVVEAGEVLEGEGPIDAVIVGSSLGHEGREVLRRARALRPGAKRVVTTGRGGHRVCQTLDAALALVDEGAESSLARAMMAP